jgi:outer membrane protein assembly factor BamB
MRWQLVMVAALLALLLLAACDTFQQSDGHLKRKTALNLAQRKPLYGGDPQAWLTRFGDNADSGYCHADLILPLNPHPAWETSYSSAQFSSSAPQGMIHYNGVLCINSITPQLMLLDVATGGELFNENVHYSELMDTQTPTVFAPFFHPAGLLLVRDESATAYCYDLTGGKLSKDPLWVVHNKMGGEDNTCVAQGDVAVFGGQGQTRGLSITDGTELWSYPSLQPYPGKVLSRDGVAVWFSQFGKVLALELESGILLWGLNLQEQISRLIVDDQHGCVYLTTYDERLECRDLHTGELRWEYSWRALLSEPERTQLLARTLATYRTPLQRVQLLAESVNCIPDGLLITLVNGSAIALNMDGKPRWRKDTGQPVVMVLTFNNGALLLQEYSQVGDQRQLGKYLPFMFTPPDWKIYKDASDERRRTVQFDRFLVLALADGAELATCEMEKRISTGPVPAYNMVVIGQEGEKDVQPSVCAFPWVSWKGSN